MRKSIVLLLLMAGAYTSYGQIYILKDHRDTTIPYVLFDTLPDLCDSFFGELKLEDLKSIRKFVPDLAFLKSTFDSLDVEYNEANAIYRQQKVQRQLEFQYKKLLRKAEKHKMNLKKLEKVSNELEYGTDEKGNEFCYVTLNCKRNRREYQIRFLAIRLNDKWFIGDELSLEVL